MEGENKDMLPIGNNDIWLCFARSVFPHHELSSGKLKGFESSKYGNQI